MLKLMHTTEINKASVWIFQIWNDESVANPPLHSNPTVLATTVHVGPRTISFFLSFFDLFVAVGR
jgi:hypothetical protein